MVPSVSGHPGVHSGGAVYVSARGDLGKPTPEVWGPADTIHVFVCLGHYLALSILDLGRPILVQ